MRLLFLLLLTISSYADESVVLSSTVGASIAHSIIDAQLKVHDSAQILATSSNEVLSEITLPESVRMLFQEPKKPEITVEYGNGPLFNHLEQVTLDILQYPLLSNIYTAVTDPINLTPPENRIRFTFDVNQRELKLSYSF